MKTDAAAQTNRAAGSAPRAPRAPGPWRLEWSLLAALFTIALAAGCALLFLKGRHDRRAHIAATAEVLEAGEALLDALCSPGLGCPTNPTPDQWGRFSDRVDSMFTVRPDIQSVSVSRDGVTVFHRQADRLDGALRGDRGRAGGDAVAGQTAGEAVAGQAGAGAGEASAGQAGSGAGAGAGGETELSQGVLEIGGEERPVFLLSRTRLLPDGGRIVTEAALRREAVGAEEKTARSVTASLSAFSLGVTALSFAVCAAVLSLAVARDRRREARARQEEHLAFSGVLANGILHDFRNPMSAVRLDAQMLGREMRRPGGFRPGRVEELAGRVARTMGRMDRIFREFLFLARPAGEGPPGPSELCAAVRECLDTLSPRFEQAGVTAAFDAPAGPVFADADPAAFRRALVNVLVNAVQASPRGGRVRVSLSASGGRAALDVADDGPGVPAAMRGKIFDLFVTGRPEGTGLGLFLAKTALERCGGGIRLLDTPSGAAFRLTLALSKTAKKEDT